MKNVYNIVVHVGDANGGTATQAFAITITDVAEMPGIMVNTLNISWVAPVVLPANDLASIGPSYGGVSAPGSLPIAFPRKSRTGAGDAASGKERFLERFSGHPATQPKQPEASRRESMP